jgi:16S rRNA processing protein RimM
MVPPSRTVTLGQIVGIYGVQGWVKVYSGTSPIENIFRYSPWLLEGVERRVLAHRRHHKGLIAQLDCCEDRDQARDLLGKAIVVRREQLPPPSADELYWADLEGLEVETPDGRKLGKVSHLIETGANDVLVVRGDRERLIPFIWGQVVREADVAAGRMCVDWDPDF